MSTSPPPEPLTTTPGRPAPAGRATAVAVGALLCGLVGFAFLTHPFAELAIALGLVARRRAPAGPGRGGATALAAIALGAAALLVFTVIPLATGGSPQ